MSGKLVLHDLRIGIEIIFPDAFSFAASDIAANGLAIGGSGSGTVPAPRLSKLLTSSCCLCGKR